MHPIREAKVVHEFDRISMGDSEARILLDKDAVQRKGLGEVQFTAAGVYTGRKQVFVVLPWFLQGGKDAELAPNIEGDDQTRYLIEVYSWLKSSLAAISPVSLELDNGREFVYLAMLRSLQNLIEDGLKHNVFREDIYQGSTIKGKWKISDDLKGSETPLNFTCEISECDRNNPILSLALEYCIQLHECASSTIVLSEARDLARRLVEISDRPTSMSKVLFDAKRMATSDRRFEIWLSWISVLEMCCDIGNGGDLLLVNSGVMGDLHFPTERFFEVIVEKAMRCLGYDVRTQQSRPLLGGSYWAGRGSGKDTLETWSEDGEAAKYNSRPDLIVSKGGNAGLMVECKYKPLNLVRFEGYSAIRGLNRNDRNQIISFLLSLSPEDKVNRSRVVAIFPTLDTENEKADAMLIFEANMTEVRSQMGLMWGSRVAGSNEKLGVHFIGVNLKALLKEVVGGHGPELSKLDALLNSSMTLAA